MGFISWDGSEKSKRGQVNGVNEMNKVLVGIELSLSGDWFETFKSKDFVGFCVCEFLSPFFFKKNDWYYNLFSWLYGVAHVICGYLVYYYHSACTDLIYCWSKYYL